MYKLFYTQQAREDFRSIRRYIAKTSGNAAIAKAFTQKLIEKCEELASITGVIGRARPEIMQDLRSHAFGNYVIFFRYFEQTLEVVTVIEGHKDIESHFEMN